VRLKNCVKKLGPCEACDAIHFTCPQCEAQHDRGYIDGVSVFRCLGCGYLGHGFHADHIIDQGVAADIRAAQQWNVKHGLPKGPFFP
jgi:Zn ribbon nucleic-acid-binding protein